MTDDSKPIIIRQPAPATQSTVINRILADDQREDDRQDVTPETKPPVQYVLVRRDIPISKQVIFIAHAKSEAIRVAPIDPRTILRALWVEDEDQLLAYLVKLRAKNFGVTVSHEPEAPWNGEPIALSTEPMTERVSAISKIVFPLKRADFDRAPERARMLLSTMMKASTLINAGNPAGALHEMTVALDACIAQDQDSSA